MAAVRTLTLLLAMTAAVVGCGPVHTTPEASSAPAATTGGIHAVSGEVHRNACPPTPCVAVVDHLDAATADGIYTQVAAAPHLAEPVVQCMALPIGGWPTLIIGLSDGTTITVAFDCGAAQVTAGKTTWHIRLSSAVLPTPAA